MIQINVTVKNQRILLFAQCNDGMIYDSLSINDIDKVKFPINECKSFQYRMMINLLNRQLSQLTEQARRFGDAHINLNI